MNVLTYSCGPFAANCYIAESGDAAVIIDPGHLEKGIADYISQNPGKIKYILLTHGHCDHIFAAAAVRKMTGAEIVIGKGDEKGLTDDDFNLSSAFGSLYGHIGNDSKDEITVSDGDVLTAGDMEFKVIATPGHSPGGVCYLCGDVLFSGDTLFAGTVGRTDFPHSKPSNLLRSLEKLKALDDGIKVFPGHGECTAVGIEKQSNIFLNYQGGF